MRPFRQLTGWLRSRLRPERKRTLQEILEGYRGTALLYVAAKLNIADQLANGPRTSKELSATIGAHAPTLHRVLRGLAVLGVCVEKPGGVFELTPLGRRLRSDADGPEYSLAILNGEEYAAAWNHLLHSVKSGDTAFDDVFGESAWEHRRKNPALNQRFNDWLEKGAAAAGRALLQAHDFSRHQTVADLGGGQGALLGVLLETHSSLQGILFDQPHVLAAARSRLDAGGLAARCRIVEGNFFESIPAGADVHILKSVLHDWDDQKCLILLRNSQKVLKPGQSLLVVEKILPDFAAERPATILGDLHMLAVTGGRERSADEYRKLLIAAGFELRKITLLSTGHSVLEAVRV